MQILWLLFCLRENLKGKNFLFRLMIKLRTLIMSLNKKFLWLVFLKNSEMFYSLKFFLKRTIYQIVILSFLYTAGLAHVLHIALKATAPPSTHRLTSRNVVVAAVTLTHSTQTGAIGKIGLRCFECRHGLARIGTGTTV